jgi:hypothetical protein
MAQTALQELIEYAKKEAGFISDSDSLEDRFARQAYRDIVKKAQSLLPKERQIIEDAYVKGCSDTYGSDEPSTDPKYNDAAMASDYFTQNFNH